MKHQLARRIVFCIVLGLRPNWAEALHPSADRQVTNLSGTWRIAADPDRLGTVARWYEPGRFPIARPAVVPSEWETALGIDYDGLAWYHREFQVPRFQKDQRALLRLYGAATEARIWVNGIDVGAHTGPWTPFTFDITSLVTGGETASIAVRLDEKVGHNTQGFLPIIAPHFGGLWQKVELTITGVAHLDDARIVIDASDIDVRTNSAKLNVSVPVVGRSDAVDSVRFVLADPDDKQICAALAQVRSGAANWNWAGNVRLWALDKPNMYVLRTELLDRGGGVLDAVGTRFGFRQVTAQGSRILLNGEDLVVRGVLTWGYYPPHLAPAPDPKRFREQLRYLRSCGFNLIKFCLWLPPKKFLDIVDAEGMLAWVEYPTWHPKIDQAHKKRLITEYTEMSHHDGNHPCVILRSITCETGPSADLNVIQELYDLIKCRCPGTLVVDDSSWIGWNRIHDFWDDHSYGNDRTWRDKLTSLQHHVQTHGVKPLLLGEAIAADTWVDLPRLMASAGSEAWWLPGWAQKQGPFEEQLRRRFAHGQYDPVADLHAGSLKYAMDMRRWQIETYRHQLPHAGYVVSTIRDVTLCAMGLLDNLGQPKWPASDWSFHGAVMTPLNTQADQHAFEAGSDVTFEQCLRTSAQAELLPPTEIRWSLGGQEEVLPYDPNGSSVRVSLELPSQVGGPRQMSIERSIAAGDTRSKTSWEVWVLPKPVNVPKKILLYGDTDGQLKNIFPEARALEPGRPVPAQTAVVAGRVMSKEVLDYLQAGGCVLHLTSDRSASFKTEGTWFLRGTAWAPDRPEAFFDRCPGPMLSYLQLFEWGGNAVIRGEELWDQVDPLLTFIETHDLKIVRPNLFLFETGVGKGRLIVSCLRHKGTLEGNYAGHWLARELAAYLRHGAAPTRSLNSETIRVLYENLATETMDVDTTWRFTTDPENKGFESGFYKVDYDDTAWQTIESRTAQEGQIWNRYDGWGWYRQTITVRPDWKGRPVRIVFHSVDDMYRLYVNGELAGAYGKIDRSESSFLKRTWADITEHIEYGTDNALAVHVHDWVGSGGLNGKVWLTTGRADERMELLRR